MKKILIIITVFTELFGIQYNMNISFLESTYKDTVEEKSRNFINNNRIGSLEVLKEVLKEKEVLNQKICISGIHQGKLCSTSSDCGEFVECISQGDYIDNIIYNINYNVYTSPFANIKIKPEFKMTCSNFTSNLTEKVGMMIAAVLMYVQDHLLQNILTEVFGIPDLTQPGAMVKWTVELISQIACLPTAAAMTLPAIAGKAVVVLNSALTQNSEGETEESKGGADTITGGIDGKETENKKETEKLGNVNAADLTKSTITDFTLKKIKDNYGSCVKWVKKTFNNILEAKLDNIEIPEAEKKKRKTMCEVAATLKKQKHTHTAKISPFMPVQKPINKTQKIEKDGIVQELKETMNNNKDNTNKQNKENRIIAYIQKDKIIEKYIEDKIDMKNYITSCKGKGTLKVCLLFYDFINDINYCIDELYKENSVIREETELMSDSIDFNNICNILSCGSPNNNRCIKNPQYDKGYIQEYTPTTIISFAQNSSSQKNVKNIFNKIVEKKDICLKLSVMSKEERTKLIYSYLVAKGIEQNLTTSNFQKHLEEYLEPMLVNEGFQKYIKYYCKDELEKEIKSLEVIMLKEPENMGIEDILLQQIEKLEKMQKNEMVILTNKQNIEEAKNIIKICTISSGFETREENVLMIKFNRSNTVDIDIERKKIEPNNNIIKINGKDISIDYKTSFYPINMFFKKQKKENAIMKTDKTLETSKITLINTKITSVLNGLSGLNVEEKRQEVYNYINGNIFCGLDLLHPKVIKAIEKQKEQNKKDPSKKWKDYIQKNFKERQEKDINSQKEIILKIINTHKDMSEEIKSVVYNERLTKLLYIRD